MKRTQTLNMKDICKRKLSDLKSDLKEVTLWKELEVIGTERMNRNQSEHLKNWLFQHLDYPYPTADEKKKLSYEAGLSVVQVSGWFQNVRKRKLYQTDIKDRKSECTLSQSD
ncbi:hypothetical protein AKO1_011991 [Acrasis kona]|uniref:Homeobox domain-containing protein n=1 Tax=Acrasis kona TaxID=1008807 RepID=A0AAW2ZAF0_9EUKA